MAIVGLDELRTEIGRTLRSAGVRGRYVTCGECVGYEYSLPSQRGTLRVRSFVAPPIEIGAKGKFRKKLRKGLSKIVKNKAFQALGKVALSVVPGGGAITTATETAAKAARAIKAAKRARVSGDDRPMRALPRALQIEAARLRTLRANWRP